MNVLEMEYAGLRKVVSGGQQGVDEGALHAAKDAGIATGGWAPKGYRVTTGSNHALKTEYGLQEHSSAAYQPRTEQNVIDSDGTLVIASCVTSPGTALTLRFLRKHNRPFFIVDLPKGKHWSYDGQRASNIANWIIRNNIEVLNVAGNHLNPAYHHTQTWDILIHVLDTLADKGRLVFTQVADGRTIS